jgi:cell division protein FtsB
MSECGCMSIAQVRWDRVGRIAMLCVMVAIAYLYLSAGLRLLSAWGESKRDSAQVRGLEAQNGALRRQHARLASPDAAQADARRLGMIHAGEQAYIVSGLPPN